MNTTDTHPQAQKLLTGSPFRSGYFVFMSIVALAAILWDAYLVLRYWHSLSGSVIEATTLFVGIQLIYLWMRAVFYLRKFKRLHDSAPDSLPDAPLSVSLRIGAFATTEMAFYSFGLVIVELALIGSLLHHLYGMK